MDKQVVIVFAAAIGAALGQAPFLGQGKKQVLGQLIGTLLGGLFGYIIYCKGDITGASLSWN